MLPAESVRGEFALKLVPAFSVLVFLFSYIVYGTIEQSIDSDLREELLKVATRTAAVNALPNADPLTALPEEVNPKQACTINMIVEEVLEEGSGIRFRKIRQGSDHLAVLHFPYDLETNRYIKVTKDVTNIQRLLEHIRNIIIVLNLLAIVFIAFFSYLFSSLLAKPVRTLSAQLAKMDEHSLTQLDNKVLPEEFRPLAKTLNNLLRRLKGHIGYQRELFIGVAHELKTPLAVIKLKNEVTLMKPREPEKYVEALRNTTKAAGEMDKMIKSILEIGRAEYAQFDPPEIIDIGEYLGKKAADYSLLAESEGKKLTAGIVSDGTICKTQPTLLSHIIQNFVQNAIKFTPAGKEIFIEAYPEKGHYVIRVIDEGCGIDEGLDIFGPFKRKGDKQGVGLGLFLAKSAADAMNAHISVENRKEAQGTVATLVLECH